MAFRRRRRRFFRRNPLRYRSRAKRRIPYRARVPRMLAKVTAPRIRVKLEYNRDFTLAASSPSVAQYHTFRLNSLFDPDLTGIGGQCSGFDEWATLYEKYCVYGCKVTVRCVNKTSNPAVVVMFPSAVQPSSITDSETARQQAGAVYRMLGASTGYDAKVMSRYYTISSIYGVSKRAVLESDGYRSLVSTNPANQALITIMVDSSPTQAAYDVTYNIQMVFYAELSSRQSNLDD